MNLSKLFKNGFLVLLLAGNILAMDEGNREGGEDDKKPYQSRIAKIQDKITKVTKKIKNPFQIQILTDIVTYSKI